MVEKRLRSIETSFDTGRVQTSGAAIPGAIQVCFVIHQSTLVNIRVHLRWKVVSGQQLLVEGSGLGSHLILQSHRHTTVPLGCRNQALPRLTNLSSKHSTCLRDHFPSRSRRMVQSTWHGWLGLLRPKLVASYSPWHAFMY